MQFIQSSSVVLALLVDVARTVDVTLSLSAPSDAPTISPDLVSLSIEQDRWPEWSGTDSRNAFFYNVLDNLKQLTGAPPQIRIGANSEDRAFFDPNIELTEATFPDPTPTVPYPEALNATIGDGFFRLAKYLPRDTRVTWGLNLGANNLTNAVLEVNSLVRAFAAKEVKAAGVTLDHIELGNEPDLYRNNGLRSPNYTAADYTADWIRFAQNVSEAAGMRDSGLKFLAGSFAGAGHTAGFSPQAIFDAGILDSEPGKFIQTISQHRYSGSFCAGSGGLLLDLMTKSTIRGNLSIFIEDVGATHAKGLDYVLGETNSYSCHGAPGVSNSAGASLWTLDYALFATQIGVSNVFFHEGVGYKYSLIQPAELTRSILDGSPLPEPVPPHVQPQYYAAVIIAEATGTSGTTQIIEVEIENPHVAGYAFYEHGHLARAVFINSEAYFGNATRSSIHIDLEFAGGLNMKHTKLVVKRLNIGQADDAAGLTWGGQTYETSDGRVGGRLQIETSSLDLGFNITQTEAVLVSFR